MSGKHTLYGEGWNTNWKMYVFSIILVLTLMGIIGVVISQILTLKKATEDTTTNTNISIVRADNSIEKLDKITIEIVKMQKQIGDMQDWLIWQDGILEGLGYKGKKPYHNKLNETPKNLQPTLDMAIASLKELDTAYGKTYSLDKIDVAVLQENIQETLFHLMQLKEGK